MSQIALQVAMKNGRISEFCLAYFNLRIYLHLQIYNIKMSDRSTFHVHGTIAYVMGPSDMQATISFATPIFWKDDLAKMRASTFCLRSFITEILQ